MRKLLGIPRNIAVVVAVIVISLLVLQCFLRNWKSNGELRQPNYSVVDYVHPDRNQFRPIFHPNHDSELRSFANASSKFEYTVEYVPLLCVFTRSGVYFLERFIRSIDWKVEVLLIVQDSLEDKRVFSLLQSLRNDRKVSKFVKIIEHVVNIHHTGCAQAWNTALRLYPGEPFYIFAANDVELQPQSLKSLYLSVLETAKTNDSVGMVSSRVDFGDGHVENQFSLMFWAFMRNGLLRAGSYDENFYPAYYEDDDILWRLFLSGMQIVVQPHVMVAHGLRHGIYLSGTTIEDSTGRFKREVQRSTNQHYLALKWGNGMRSGYKGRILEVVARGLLSFYDHCGQLHPKDHLYEGLFCSSFNTSHSNLHDWTFHPFLRDCLEREGNQASQCLPYLDDFRHSNMRWPLSPF